MLYMYAVYASYKDKIEDEPDDILQVGFADGPDESAVTVKIMANITSMNNRPIETVRLLVDTLNERAIQNLVERLYKDENNELYVDE